MQEKKEKKAAAMIRKLINADKNRNGWRERRAEHQMIDSEKKKK